MLRFAGLILALLVPAFAQAQDARADGGWARAPAGAGGAMSVYFTLHGGTAADRLVGVETESAGMAMLHESATENGVSVMRMLDGVDIPAGATVTLRPGGMHVMLEALARRPAVGDTLALRLHFAHGPDQTLAVGVRPPGAPAP